MRLSFSFESVSSTAVIDQRVGTSFLFFFRPRRPAERSFMIADVGIFAFSSSSMLVVDFASVSSTRSSTFFSIFGFSSRRADSTRAAFAISGTRVSFSVWGEIGFFSLNSVAIDFEVMATSCRTERNFVWSAAFFMFVCVLL